MDNRKKIESLWDKFNLNEKVRKHILAVNKKAVEIAEKLKRDGINVDIELVSTGSLVHDIGRSINHSIKHGIAGYKILKEEGFPEEICRIARNHIGAGIWKKEAVELGLPAEDFIPETIEQKIVSYADNLAEGERIRTFEETLEIWKKKFGPDSEQVRLFKLEHAEIENYISSKEMRNLDKKAVQKGISVKELMENAGRESARLIEKNFEMIGRRIVIFAGAGNNGGDGLVSAYYLKKAGFDVQVLLFGAPENKECTENLNRASESGIPVSEIKSSEDLDSIEGDIAVDSLLGTGIQGEIREPIATGIKKINEFERTASVDIPSGLNPDTGEESAVIVKPDLIITFHKFKKGLVGKYELGTVEIADIGIR